MVPWFVEPLHFSFENELMFRSSGVNSKVLAIFLVLTGVSELHAIAISLNALVMNRPYCAGLV